MNHRDTITETRRRALLLTYHYDRAATMESRLSWRRAQHAAEQFEATVVCAYGDEEGSPHSSNEPSSDSRVRVISFAHNRLEHQAMRLPWGFYLAYRLWHRRVLKWAALSHEENPFDVVHHVSFCGYREPSDGWRLDAPFVWGPIGGTHNFPMRFLGQLNFMGAVRELARNALNSWQLRHSRLVKQAMQAAEVVAVASESAKQALASLADSPPRVLLETGVDPVPVDREARDPREPLKILWSGRLQCWKALPLLLRAIAQLPETCRVQLRVMGEGPCEASWKKLASKLGVEDQIEWIGWPNYQGQLPQYQWADCFAFTSLRDTSGTGLLEALAAGAPIIGVDHQGAADIMTDRCAVPIAVTSPKQTISSFCDAIVQLADDPQRLSDLSRGAVIRSLDFSWDRQREAMQALYAEALLAAPVPAKALEGANANEKQPKPSQGEGSEAFEETLASRRAVLSS